MKKVFVVFCFVFVCCFLQSCIPIKNVTVIDNYKLIEGKYKSKKVSKKFTKYKISNYANKTKFISFLKTRYDVFEYKNKAYVTSKLFKDLPVNFNLEFKFDEYKGKSISLINLLFNKNLDNDNLDDDDSEEIVQDGDIFRYIEITVTDDAQTDYLKNDSPYKDRVIAYLQNLKNQYNFYTK